VGLYIAPILNKEDNPQNISFAGKAIADFQETFLFIENELFELSN
jgi:hypothetical protein